MGLDNSKKKYGDKPGNESVIMPDKARLAIEKLKSGRQPDNSSNQYGHNSISDDYGELKVPSSAYQSQRPRDSPAYQSQKDKGRKIE